MTAVPSLAEFTAAAASLDGVISRTPTELSRALSETLGSTVMLKMENLQRTGSFKVRGATYRLSRLTDEERARGVVAASAGNHAQGVALAAQMLGIPATIFMPLGVPVPKLLATRGYGAEVVLEGETVATSLRLAAEFAERTAARAERVNTTLASVSVQKPKPVQLFTSAAPLPVWVRNDLPWPVTVNLFSTPSDNRLDIQPVTEVKALASSATRVDVPIEARVASGQVDVRFRLESDTGVPIGQPEVADVTLRADWEGIGLGIFGGVIGLLLVVGVVRMVRRRRADAADETPEESK